MGRDIRRHPPTDNKGTRRIGTYSQFPLISAWVVWSVAFSFSKTNHVEIPMNNCQSIRSCVRGVQATTTGLIQLVFQLIVWRCSNRLICMKLGRDIEVIIGHANTEDDQNISIGTGIKQDCLYLRTG